MFASVAIDVPLRTIFTYSVPESLQNTLARGHFVLVPFGRKKTIGVCLRSNAAADTSFDSNRIKHIEKNCSLEFTHPQLDELYLQWIEFAASYYLAPIGQVLAQAVPSYYFDPDNLDKTSQPKSKAPLINSSFGHKSITLSDEQSKILNTISNHRNQFYPALLHGITGSGKTEIYIQLMHQTLATGKSALFLVPEIGLTPQMLSRLNQHFEGKLLIYHSSLTHNQRINHWQQCLEPEPRIMVGTRSALFAPFKNLGLIVIDEEHDNSYKQDDRFRYHARDLAIKRAHLHNIPIVLGSATPSLETYHLAQQKKYHYFELKNRFGAATLPQIRVVDFGKEREQTGAHLLVSQNIHQAIEHFYKERRQIMIFVGQRGFAQNAFCNSCSTIQVCPNCSVGIKYHKPGNLLRCHYCNFEKVFDEICLTCQHKALTLMGFGTQSIEDEIRTMHPTIKIRRIDSDTATSLKQITEIFESFARQEFNLLIGTQMISKGHDFANVGFVGVLGIDAHLGLPEFRASERAFQNLVQVSGRAGRADNKGHVIVQSLMPEHPSIKLGVLQDYKNFADQELHIRESLNYPPFSRIVQIRFLSNHQDQLKTFCKSFEKFLDRIRFETNPSDVHILGPAEMPIAKVRGKFRMHVLFKIRRGLKSANVIEYVMDHLEGQKLAGIQFQVDVDAVNLV